MDKWDRETNASFLRREGEKFRKRGDAECQWYFEVADQLVADGARIEQLEAEISELRSMLEDNDD